MKVVVAVYALWGLVVVWLILASNGEAVVPVATLALIYASGIALLALYRRRRWPTRAVTWLVLGGQALFALALLLVLLSSDGVQ